MVILKVRTEPRHRHTPGHEPCSCLPSGTRRQGILRRRASRVKACLNTVAATCTRTILPTPPTPSPIRGCITRVCTQLLLLDERTRLTLNSKRRSAPEPLTNAKSGYEITRGGISPGINRRKRKNKLYKIGVRCIKGPSPRLSCS